MPRCRQDISAKALAFWIIPATVACDHFKRKDFMTSFSHMLAAIKFQMQRTRDSQVIQCRVISPCMSIYERSSEYLATNEQKRGSVSYILSLNTWAAAPSHHFPPDLSGCPVTRLVRNSPMNSARCSSGLAEVTAQSDCRWFVSIFVSLNTSFPGHQKSRNITFSESTFSETSWYAVCHL